MERIRYRLSCSALLYSLLVLSLSPSFVPVARAAAGRHAIAPFDRHAERVRLRTVEFIPDQNAVLATGWVNQVTGNLELLACGPGGKTHESIFLLNIDAMDLQTAMLLLGAKPGGGVTGMGQGDPKGALTEIWVEWKEGDQWISRRAEEFIYNIEKEDVLPPITWVFTGSVIEHGEFRALAEESLAVTYWDPWAVFNIGHPSGTNDDILVVNRKQVPEMGTPVTLWFKVLSLDDPMPMR